MKWVYRLLTMILLAGALAIPFFIDNKQGQPMLSVPSVSDLVPSAEDVKALKHDPGRIMGQRTVYKWQDANGVWHYGDAPPKQSANVSTLQVDGNTNIIQSVKVEQNQASQASTPNAVTEQALPSTTSEVLSIDNAMKIIENAQSARAMMEARGEQLKQIVGDQ